MSNYTTSLGLEEITPGDQAGLWGNTTNNNLALIDQAIAGVTPVYLDTRSGYTYVLTTYNGAFDESRAAVINVTYSSSPASGANFIEIPSAQKLYVFRNSSGQDITVQTSAAAYTVTLKNGEATLVFCDGTNAFPGIATSGVGTLTVPYGGTGVTSFGGSPGFVYTPGGTGSLGVVTSINLSTSVSNTLPVANGGTGQTSFTSGSLLVGNGTGGLATLSGGASGQVATWNGSTWTAATPSTSAVASVFGRTGAITALSSDYSSYYAPLTNPSFTGTVTASTGFSTPGSVVATSGFNFTSNTSWAYNSGTSTVQLAINGQSAATFNYSNGIVSSGSLTTGVNASYYNTQAYVTSNSLGVNGTGIPSNNGIYYDVVGAGWVISGGAGRLSYVFTNSFAACGSDNAASSGQAAARWSQVYAVSGTINTSDINEKTEIANLDDAEKRVATRIKGLIKKFKWKDSVLAKGSDNARIHVGVMAQEVGDAFIAEGLDPHKYGMFCYDEWSEQPESVDDKGVVMQSAVSAGSRYGVRYDQLLAFVIAAL